MKYLQNKIWKINKRGGPNKKGGRIGVGVRGGGDVRQKIKKLISGGGGGTIIGIGEYRQNKQNFASVGFVSFKIKQKNLIV